MRPKAWAEHAVAVEIGIGRSPARVLPFKAYPSWKRSLNRIQVDVSPSPNHFLKDLKEATLEQTVCFWFFRFAGWSHDYPVAPVAAHEIRSGGWPIEPDLNKGGQSNVPAQTVHLKG